MTGVKVRAIVAHAKGGLEEDYPGYRFELRGVHVLDGTSADVLFFDPDNDVWYAMAVVGVYHDGMIDCALMSALSYREYVERGGTLQLPIDCYKVEGRHVSWVVMEHCTGACTYRDGDDTKVLSAWTSREAARSALVAWETEHDGLGPVEHRATAGGADNAGLDDKRCETCHTEARIFEVEVLDGVPS